MTDAAMGSTRDARLDLAKAMAILLILYWHLDPVRISMQEGSARQVAMLIDYAVHIVRYQIALTAVPLFILVSLHIVFARVSASPAMYLLRRCRRLLSLFLFWSGCQIVLCHAVAASYSTKPVTQLSCQVSGMRLCRMVMQGGPPLPVVGPSVFYFLFVLIILTMASSLLCMTSDRRSGVIGGILLIVLSLAWFEVSSLIGYQRPYWTIDNFLLYVPVAYFSLHMPPSRLKSVRALLWTMFLIFSLHDILLRRMGYTIQGYARVSVVCGSTAFFMLICALPPDMTISRMTGFLAKYSLGIFAMHKYWQFVVMSVSDRFSLADSTAMQLPMGLVGIDSPALISAVVIVLLTLATVWLLGRTRLSGFVR